MHTLLLAPCYLLPLTHDVHICIPGASEIVTFLSTSLSGKASICQRDHLQSGLSRRLIYYGERWGLLFDRLLLESARLADQSRSLCHHVPALHARRISTNLPHKALIYLGYGFSSGSPVL